MDRQGSLSASRLQLSKLQICVKSVHQDWDSAGSKNSWELAVRYEPHGTKRPW